MTVSTNTIRTSIPLLAEQIYAAFLGCAVGESLSLNADWGENTALILATADSISEAGRIDYPNIMDKFLLYFQEGKYTSSGTVLDGSIISKYAVLRYQNGFSPLFCGAMGENTNGSAALARILPAALYCHVRALPFEDRVFEINNITSLTHNHEISWLGCNIFTDYIGFLLNGISKTEALQKLQTLPYDRYFTEETLKKYQPILTGAILNFSEKEILSSGHILPTLESCLWSVLHTDNYLDAMLTAIHLSGSTGPACAITGALCGILYGTSSIPKNQLNKLTNRAYFDQLIHPFINILLKENLI